jgi:hypothetical protein
VAQGYARQDAVAPTLSPVYGDVPTGLVDGVNVTYILSAAPYAAAAAVYWNGQRLLGSDYSITGDVLTMAWPPTEGVILCDYWI